MIFIDKFKISEISISKKNDQLSCSKQVLLYLKLYKDRHWQVKSQMQIINSCHDHDPFMIYSCTIILRMTEIIVTRNGPSYIPTSKALR